MEQIIVFNFAHTCVIILETESAWSFQYYNKFRVAQSRGGQASVGGRHGPRVATALKEGVLRGS